MTLRVETRFARHRVLVRTLVVQEWDYPAGEKSLFVIHRVQYDNCTIENKLK